MRQLNLLPPPITSIHEAECIYTIIEYEVQLTHYMRETMLTHQQIDLLTML